jgi:Zn-finger nucleic acid-binding protein
MPLLMCPNDNSAMTTVERTGVQFDMCPTCRGVWLDRGEMEKLMEAARNEGPSAQQPAPPPGGAAYRPHTYDSGSLGGHARSSGEWGERGEGGEWGERGERGHGGHRRRSIFDIFD